MYYYYLRPPERLALAAMRARRSGVRVLFLEGPPGTGKTSLGYYLAQQVGGKVVYYLCHPWTTDEELFVGVDVGAVAAGVERPADAYRPGALLRAVQLSHDGPVVLILDELDKAPPRVDALLLDFLQEGRVHGPKGEEYRGRLDALFVMVTTNGVRPLSEPLLRRGMRVRLDFLPPNVEADIIRHRTGAPTGAIRLTVRMANAIRRRGETTPSLQEMVCLLEDLGVAQGPDDVEVLLRGWLVKTPADWRALTEELKNPAAALWGEWQRGKGDHGSP